MGTSNQKDSMRTHDSSTSNKIHAEILSEDVAGGLLSGHVAGSLASEGGVWCWKTLQQVFGLAGSHLSSDVAEGLLSGDVATHLVFCKKSCVFKVFFLAGSLLPSKRFSVGVADRRELTQISTHSQLAPIVPTLRLLWGGYVL